MSVNTDPATARPPRQGLLNTVGAALINGLFPSRCGGCQRFWTPPRTLSEVVGRISDRLQTAGPGAGGAAPADQDLPEPWQQGAAEVAANWLCPACRDHLYWIRPPYCTSCGRQFPSRHGCDHPCAQCSGTPPNYRRARAWGLYDGSLQVIIQKFKYRRQVQWADPLGLILYLAAGGHGLLKHCDIVLPVPLHFSRLRQRGFNQSFLMLRKWDFFARRLPFQNTLPAIDAGLLQRRRPTLPQAGLALQARQANVRDAFRVQDPGMRLREKRVLLVDDVLTTGATVAACVQAIQTTGRAAEVSVLTLANTN